MQLTVRSGSRVNARGGRTLPKKVVKATEYMKQQSRGRGLIVFETVDLAMDNCSLSSAGRKNSNGSFSILDKTKGS